VLEYTALRPFDSVKLAYKSYSAGTQLSVRPPSGVALGPVVVVSVPVEFSEHLNDDAGMEPTRWGAPSSV
jgi:hypothetical protein